MKTAIIWGCTGQDGSYLAELLLEKGYKVIGVSRRVSVSTYARIEHLLNNPNFKTIEGDVTDALCVDRIIWQHDPANYVFGDGDNTYEIYNLAAQSHVATSFEQPSFTTQVTYLGCLNILESIRNHYRYNSFDKRVRFYQASSSEMFGSTYSLRWTEHGVRHYDLKKSKLEDLYAECAYQDESTPMLPNSPYAIAKLAAHNLVRVYREAYGLFSCSGILFNHESERRGEAFVTRKITKYLGEYLYHGKAVRPLKLGNLDAKRDWGHAEDYVFGMWLMLQQEKPDDYVLATGEAHTVKEFLLTACGHAGIEVGNEIPNFVEIDGSLTRPCEVPFLRGDASKAKTKLGWHPQVTFNELVRRMVYHDSGCLYETTKR